MKMITKIGKNVEFVNQSFFFIYPHPPANKNMFYTPSLTLTNMDVPLV